MDKNSYKASSRPMLSYNFVDSIDSRGLPIHRIRLQGVDFSDAILTDSKFIHTNLHRANFTNSNLTRAIFYTKDTYEIILDGAILTDVKMQYCIMPIDIIPQLQQPKDLKDIIFLTPVGNDSFGNSALSSLKSDYNYCIDTLTISQVLYANDSSAIVNYISDFRSEYRDEMLPYLASANVTGLVAKIDSFILEFDASGRIEKSVFKEFEHLFKKQLLKYSKPYKIEQAIRYIYFRHLYDNEKMTFIKIGICQ